MLGGEKQGMKGSVMNPLDKAILDRFKALVSTRFQLHKVVLFGSRARGDADPDSDLDVVVVLEDAADGGDRGGTCVKNEEVTPLVRYRLEQADAALGDAKFLLEGNRSPQSIVNRAYYAMLYAALALLQKLERCPPSTPA